MCAHIAVSLFLQVCGVRDGVGGRGSGRWLLEEGKGMEENTGLNRGSGERKGHVMRKQRERDEWKRLRIIKNRKQRQ